jgi:hypothetical protein
MPSWKKVLMIAITARRPFAISAASFAVFVEHDAAEVVLGN